MNILISSCLLGENVKYNGLNNKIDTYLFESILLKHHVFSFCPEVEGGLPIPRAEAQIKSINPIIVETINKEDVTLYFIQGANKALDLCKKNNIDIALLKSKSPSCGNFKIYDGNFQNQLIDGSGVTAKLLKDNGVKVFNEQELEKLYETLNQLS